MNILGLILSPIIGLVVGIFFMGLYRIIMARIHWRYGPPLYQPVIDIIKLFLQKSISHGVLFELGVLVSLAGSVVTLYFIPIGNICPLQVNGGLLVVLYLLLIAPLGIALSGGSGANPNISIGISRKMLLALSYEIPFLIIVLTLMFHYRTISLVELVHFQRISGWGIISLPLAGIAYLLILPAMLGIRPFEIVEAPQEIASGLKTEYSGRLLALYYIEHAFRRFIVIALFVDLFLGGGGEPFTFLLKMLIVFMLGVFINAVFPRFKIQQAIRFNWTWPTIISLIGLLIVYMGK
ncbi:NADH-quinone oxidoreductase subunit H [candidate division WOR-3 bacterium]|nr:NADH-quinone oxidoreductase subunit H [candidate division WOR-3 bacterium]